MKVTCCLAAILFLAAGPTLGQAPSRQETIQPIHQKTFDREGAARERRQGGNPREVGGLLAFDGSMDGNRQVDPQIAVGGGFVLHATNSGLVIYDKQGAFVDGVSQNAFNGGIDPKLFFDPHSRVFGFDLWNPWDEEKLKPVNISVSSTSDTSTLPSTIITSAKGSVPGAESDLRVNFASSGLAGRFEATVTTGLKVLP